MDVRLYVRAERASGLGLTTPYTSRAKTIDVHINIIQNGGSSPHRVSGFSLACTQPTKESSTVRPVCTTRTRTPIFYIRTLATTAGILRPPPERHRFRRTTISNPLLCVCNVLSIWCRYTRTAHGRHQQYTTPSRNPAERRHERIVYAVRKNVYFPTETLTSDFIKT